MPRQKKDGHFLNCYIRVDIFDRLVKYCDDTSIPKTAVVEKALDKYLDLVMDDESDSHITDSHITNE